VVRLVVVVVRLVVVVVRLVVVVVRLVVVVVRLVVVVVRLVVVRLVVEEVVGIVAKVVVGISRDFIKSWLFVLEYDCLLPAGGTVKTRLPRDPDIAAALDEVRLVSCL